MALSNWLLMAKAFLKRGPSALRNRPDYFVEYWRLLDHPEMEREPGGWRYRGRFYPDLLMVGGASMAVVPAAKRLLSGEGIDIGAGFWPFPGATAVDSGRGNGSRSLKDVAPASLDYVFSSHCLEHIAEWQDALAGWIALLRPGGRLFLYLPHPDCALWHPGSPVVGDGHKWMPTPEVIRSHLAGEGMKIVAAEDGPDGMASFWICAELPLVAAEGV